MSKYTKREFNRDLKKLARLIESHEKSQNGGNDHMMHSEMEDDHMMHSEMEGEHMNGGSRRRQRRSKSRRRRQNGGMVTGYDPMDIDEGSVNMEGGRTKHEEKRTFKVVSINGKQVSFGNYKISKDTPVGPSRAAAKAASSVCAKHNGKSGKKVSMDCNGLKFMLKEKTRGSNQKEFGPYIVKVVKRSAKEMDKLKKSFKSFGKGKYKPSTMKATAVLHHNK